MGINPLCWFAPLCPREGHNILFEIPSSVLKPFILVSRIDLKLSYNRFVNWGEKSSFGVFGIRRHLLGL